MTSCWQTGAQSLSPCDIRTRTCPSPACGGCASLKHSAYGKITGKQQRAICVCVNTSSKVLVTTITGDTQECRGIQVLKYSREAPHHVFKGVPFSFIIQSSRRYFPPTKSANKVWWVANLLRRDGCENILNPSIATCDSDECRALKTCPCF